MDARTSDTGPQDYRQAIANLATGVTVITTMDSHGQRQGMTANAVTSLSLAPDPQLLVCVSNHLPTHGAISGHGRFAVNVLSEDQQHLALRFARPADDKFAGLAVHLEHGVPILSEAMAWFACDTVERYPGGDHSIFIGRVEACQRCSRGKRPLLFFQSTFGCMSEEESLASAASLMRM